MSDTFGKLGVSRILDETLRQYGVTEPTPVQRRTIPALLAGKDVIAQAQTGTGKTLAFLLPILDRIDTENASVQALIVSPTRELAIQIADEVGKLAPAVGASSLAAYGGQDVEAQIRKLKRAPQVVVATPGRLLDHTRRGTIDLSRVCMLVLDEADEMLKMGFLPEVEDILRKTPTGRQTMLFSATIPDAVRRLASRYMREPQDVRVTGETITLQNIKQLVVETTDRGKLQTLVDLIGQHRPYLAVAFCRTKIRAKKLTESLLAHGIEADELHGDLTQAKREHVMKRFRDAKLQVLVATDVAARGLDVEGVTHVFNYDIPQDAESYIHRVGRTGRAGQKGMAITLVTPRDRMTLMQIEREIDKTLEKRKAEARQAAGTQDGAGRSREAERGTAGGRGGRGERRAAAPSRGDGQRRRRDADARGRAGGRGAGGRSGEAAGRTRAEGPRRAGTDRTARQGAERTGRRGGPAAGGRPEGRAGDAGRKGGAPRGGRGRRG